MILNQSQISELLTEALCDIKLPFYYYNEATKDLNFVPEFILGIEGGINAANAMLALADGNVFLLFYLIKEITAALKLLDAGTEQFLELTEFYRSIRNRTAPTIAKQTSPEELIEYRALMIERLKRINCEIVHHLMSTKEIRPSVLNLVANIYTDQLLLLAQEKNFEALSFETIIIPLVIDDALISDFVNTLEKQNTSQALLACGLLLLAEVQLPFPQRMLAMSEYKEKRIHDGITYYIRAAQNPRFRPLVEFLLWEIKTDYSIKSVKSRMAQLDVTPFALMTDDSSYDDVKKNLNPVVMPLYNEYSFFSRNMLSKSSLDEAQRNQSYLILK